MILFSPPIKGEGMDDLVRNTKALELYLQDQEDHDKYCAAEEWEQPDIDVYKEKLESQLSDFCKRRIIKAKAQEEE
tara:strand:- start:1796 stop:2023 length:228 start_codon:yes stop_codon:yes gene_type:complete